MSEQRRLLDAMPELTTRLIDAARRDGHADIAEQLGTVRIERIEYDSKADAGCIYVTESRPLNVVEANVIGVRNSHSISFDLPDTVVVDLDNFDRIQFIELIGYANEFRRLEA